MSTCLERRQLIARLKAICPKPAPGEKPIDWEAFNAQYADNVRGECLLWLISHRLDVATESKLFVTLLKMVEKEIMHLSQSAVKPRRAVLIARLNTVMRSVKAEHPSVDSGQRLPSPKAA